MAMTACFREIADEIDLLISEGTNLLAENGDDSHQFVILEHRHINYGPNATEFDGFHGRWVTFGIEVCRCYVSNLDHPLGPDCLGKVATWAGMVRIASAGIGEGWR